MFYLRYLQASGSEPRDGPELGLEDLTDAQATQLRTFFNPMQIMSHDALI